MVACNSFIKEVNSILTPRPKLNLIDLFSYFFVYISDQKRDQPIHNQIHTINFPLKTNSSKKPPLLVKLNNSLDIGFPWIINHVLEVFN